MTTPPTDPQELPQWKKDLIAEARKLIEAREANQKLRQEWMDTQPPEIKDTSIGK